MTVSTTTVLNTYSGDGSTVAFPLNAYCQSADQVRVYVDDVEISDALFTVTGVRAAGGVTVTFDTAPADDTVVVVRRILPLTQGVDTQNNEVTYQQVFDDALDRAVMIDQQVAQESTDADGVLQAEVDRAVLVPDGEAGFEIQSVATRASKPAVFDALGRIIAGVLVATTTVFGAFGISMAATADAATANVLLNQGSNTANPRAFGATLSSGNATVNTAAVQAAIDSLSATGGEVIFDGMIPVNSQIECPYDNVSFRGVGPYSGLLWKVGTVSTDPMLYITGDNCPLIDMRFYGDQYTAFGDSISPGALVRYGDATAAINEVAVTICRFVGGRDGLAVWWGVDVTLTRVRTLQNYRWGCYTSAGVKRLTVKDFRSREVGLNEGFKFGYSGTGQVVENVLIDGFDITNCGKLDTTTSNHQEGMDLYLADARRVKISNGFITGCGNGGIEFKTQHSTYSGAIDVYEQIEISNVTVNVQDLADTNQPAFALNWNDPGAGGPGLPNTDSPAATKCRRFKFTDCKAYYNPAPSGTSGSMFQISAYSDVEIINPTCYGADVFIRTDGSGGADAKVRRLRVVGGTVEANTWGVYHTNGGLEGLDIEGTKMTCGKACIILANGTNQARADSVRIFGGARLVTTSTSVNDPCLQLSSVSNFLMENASAEAEYRAIASPAASGGAPASTGGTVRNNSLKVRSALVGTNGAAFNAAEGTWRFYDNNIDIPDQYAYGWISNGVSPSAANNCRGLAASVPTNVGGNLGDYFLNSAPAAGGTEKWVCVSADDNNATWKDVAIAA